MDRLGVYVAFQMAEVAIPRTLFADIVWLVSELRPQPAAHRREVFDRHEFAQKAREEARLDANKIGIVRRATRRCVTGFGVPKHYGDGSALPMLVQSGNLRLEIWSSGGCRLISLGVQRQHL